MVCFVCKKNEGLFSNHGLNAEAHGGSGFPEMCLDCSSEFVKWHAKWTEEDMTTRNELIGYLGDLAVKLREGINSDIEVKPGSGPSIRAHKFLLETRSETLKSMLASAPDASICLPEFNHEELESFLQILYEGDLAKGKFVKHFYSLSVAAHKYGIPYMQKLCERVLIKMVNPSNALKILELSDVISNEKVKLAVLIFIVLRYKEIVLNPSFDEFAQKNPHLMLQITKASLTPSNEREIWRTTYESGMNIANAVKKITRDYIEKQT